MKGYLPLLVLLAASPIAQAQSTSYPLLKVEDGDTLVVTIEGRPTRLQLLGIDAPEDVENPKLNRDMARTGLERGSLLQLGQGATLHLKSLAAVGSLLTLEGNLKRRDKYGRIPVVARLGAGDSLNAAMVGDGYAITLAGFPLDDSLVQALSELEHRASSEQRGLWGEHPLPMRAWSGRPVTHQ